MEHRESLRFSAVLLPYCCRMAAAWLQFGPEVGYFAATPCLLSRVSKVRILHGSSPMKGPGSVAPSAFLARSGHFVDPFLSQSVMLCAVRILT